MGLVSWVWYKTASNGETLAPEALGNMKYLFYWYFQINFNPEW